MSNYKSYYFKSLGLREDSLAGGKGDETQPTNVDPQQLEMGVKVEMEHTQDEALAKEIAMDHLTEDPQYYSRLKDAGMADELPNGQQPNQGPMQMHKLMPAMPIPHPSVIAVGIRGTRSGGLPAGGYVENPEKARLGGLEKLEVLPQGGVKGDPEKARLGGWERVKNLKPNSQGAISDTPASDEIKAKGGHFTPDNGEITRGESPKTNKKGSDAIHPMQVQQLGNEPIDDDGTTRDGKETPAAATAGLEGGAAPSSTPEEHPASDLVVGKGAMDAPNPVGDNFAEPEEKEESKGPWGIGFEDDEDEDEDETEDNDRKDGVTIDIKEVLEASEDAAISTSEQAGWDDLVELSNGASFQTPMGNMDMWALLGFEGLSMSDAENQTPKFFDFILRHKNETQRFLQQQGEKIQFADIATLKKGWQASKKQTSQFNKDQANQPRACKSCGNTFTPTKGEGICSKCTTKTNECGDCGCGDPTNDHNMKDRFQKLANIKPVGEAGALSELKELVGRLNAKGKVTPTLAKAQKYLAELGSSKSVKESDSPQEAETGRLDSFIRDAVAGRNPEDNQDDVAEAVVIELEDMGVHNAKHRYDYILSMVTKYWK